MIKKKKFTFLAVAILIVTLGLACTLVTPAAQLIDVSRNLPNSLRIPILMMGAAKYPSQNWILHSELAVAYYNVGQLDQAEVALQKSINGIEGIQREHSDWFLAQNTLINNYLILANIREKEGKFNDAEAFYAKATKTDWNVAWKEYAAFLQRRKRPIDAEKALLKADRHPQLVF